MDIVLQEKLVEILDLGQLGILEAVSILKVQAPEIVKQFMAFETFSAIIGIILGTVCLVAGLVCLLHAKKEEWDTDKGSVFASILGIVFGFSIGFGVTLTYTSILSKILIAPNLYIIQNLLQVLR